MPVALSGVMLAVACPSGPVFLELPARKRVLSTAMVIADRGVWHSPQCPTARTRYSPRAPPETGAAGGGVSLEAKVMSHAGRKTLSNIGMVIFFGVLGRFTGGTLRRHATSAWRSSSAMPLKDGNGCTGRIRSPLGRRPRRIAVTIWSSVQPPMPVFVSGVMLVEYTVPKGPSYFLPPAFAAPFGSVWQPQPPVAPKMYLPRGSCSGSAASAPAAELRSRTTPSSMRVTVILQTPATTE